VRRYRLNPEVSARTHSEKNLAKIRDRRSKMSPEQKEKARINSCEAQRRYMTDPSRKLSSRVSSDIRKRLRARGASKRGQHWENLLGYTVEHLKARLESLFEPGMMWTNHGEWHIDHVVPVGAFEFKSPDDDGFKRCWALENLAPRWATTTIARAHGSLSTGNLNKGDRLICCK
jgi:hypothetical protein